MSQKHYFYAKYGSEELAEYARALGDNRIVRWSVTDMFGNTYEYRGRVWSASWIGDTDEAVFEVREGKA